MSYLNNLVSQILKCLPLKVDTAGKTSTSPFDIELAILYQREILRRSFLFVKRFSV